MSDSPLDPSVRLQLQKKRAIVREQIAMADRKMAYQSATIRSRSVFVSLLDGEYPPLITLSIEEPEIDRAFSLRTASPSNTQTVELARSDASARRVHEADSIEQILKSRLESNCPEFCKNLASLGEMSEDECYVEMSKNALESLVPDLDQIILSLLRSTEAQLGGTGPSMTAAV